MRLLEMNTHQFAELEPRLAFWPVGTIEAHDLGPLGTDVIAPEKLATDLSSDFNALLLPTLPYGLVSSLSGYPGGMWMSEDTYKSLIFELLTSLAVSGVESAIIFNGHGGNTQALSDVLPEVWKETGMKTAFLDWWSVDPDLSKQHFGSAGGHGGADELALVYAANPSIVPQTWDGSRAFLYRPGVKAYPSPRSAIRYSDDEAKPMTPESAAAYYQALKERVTVVLADILAGWADFNKPGE
ncbi:MAG: creatininase family protein [candidate division WOR-3 bacterium]|nr:creatininase family protein [candidate division WOR-3 bacterium]